MFKSSPHLDILPIHNLISSYSLLFGVLFKTLSLAMYHSTESVQLRRVNMTRPTFLEPSKDARTQYTTIYTLYTNLTKFTTMLCIFMGRNPYIIHSG